MAELKSMQVYEVEMQAFANGQIRKVEVPIEEVTGKTDDEILERIFKWGQNDFQPQQIPSVSMGDVARLNGKRYLCAAMGWMELNENEKGGLDMAFQ